VQQAPDNAAVWLLKLGQDLRDGKNDDARQDLAKAAAAKIYDDYTGATL
jgi:asparagine synthetase A